MFRVVSLLRGARKKHCVNRIRVGNKNSKIRKENGNQVLKALPNMAKAASSESCITWKAIGAFFLERSYQPVPLLGIFMTRLSGTILG